MRCLEELDGSPTRRSCSRWTLRLGCPFSHATSCNSSRSRQVHSLPMVDLVVCKLIVNLNRILSCFSAHLSHISELFRDASQPAFPSPNLGPLDSLRALRRVASLQALARSAAWWSLGSTSLALQNRRLPASPHTFSAGFQAWCLGDGRKLVGALVMVPQLGTCCRSSSSAAPIQLV